CCVSSPRRPRAPLFPYTTLFRSSVLSSCLVEPGLARHRLERLQAHGLVFVRVAHGGILLGLDDEPPLVAVLRGDPEHRKEVDTTDRKSTRLNSSHVKISYAVFCL